MLENIEVPIHSSICIRDQKIIYIDPFKIENDFHDADMILITHSHYDHFSKEDIMKVRKDNTIFIFPKKMQKEAQTLNIPSNQVFFVTPSEIIEIDKIKIETVPAYNIALPFHPKSKGWVGYIITIQNQRIYIAGDTDMNKENKQVKCDIALIPIGGTYTMNAKQAAKFVNILQPKTVIPIHYGSIVGKKDIVEEFSQEVNKNTSIVIKIK